jgi:uncharacterized protein (DUF3084 family)
MYTNGDRRADERDAALDRREAAVTLREVRLARQLVAAQNILIAGDQRDAIADARDMGAETREHHLDRAQFLAHDAEPYGEEHPQRRLAALAREQAKGDRGASHNDRVALVEVLENSVPA